MSISFTSFKIDHLKLEPNHYILFTAKNKLC